MSVDSLVEVAVRSAATSGVNGVALLVGGNGNWITVDRAGFQSVSFAMGFASPVTGTADLFLDESEDGSSFSPVAVEKILGRSSGAAATAGLVGPLGGLGGLSVRFGTTSKARYLRLRQANSSTPSGTGYCVALLSDPIRSPIAVQAW